MIRIDKYLSSLWIGSRQDLSVMCKKWLIENNGLICKKADQKVNYGSVFKVWDGKKLTFKEIECKEFVALILYKPKNFVCSDIDEWWHKSYSNLLKDCPYWETLHVAGRLDQDTTWLVICTNDGNFNHRIISPKHKLIKTYKVVCESTITDDMIIRLENWVELDDGYKTLPAKVKRIHPLSVENEWLWLHQIELQIIEGKYHQIKRMMESVENKVVELHRSSIGDWNLDELKEGERSYIDIK